MSLLIAIVYKQKDVLCMLDRNINFSVLLLVVLHEEIAEDKISKQKSVSYVFMFCNFLLNFEFLYLSLIFVNNLRIITKCGILFHSLKNTF